MNYISVIEFRVVKTVYSSSHSYSVEKVRILNNTPVQILSSETMLTAKTFEEYSEIHNGLIHAGTLPVLVYDGRMEEFIGEEP